jgi:hypothetical protein
MGDKKEKKKSRNGGKSRRGNRKIKRNEKGMETTDGSRRKTRTQCFVFDGESKPLQD